MSDSPTQLRGKLLLADPSLRFSIFHKSVIVLNQHTQEDGAMGLILNQPTGKIVGDFLTDPIFAPLSKLAVHIGGPVEQNQLTFSSFWWSKKLGLSYAIRISAESAAQHVRRPGRVVRAFIGYSGWSSGQLENELEVASWFPIDPQPALLGQNHDPSLWANLLAPISPYHRLIAEAPDDPLLN